MQFWLSTWPRTASLCNSRVKMNNARCCPRVANARQGLNCREDFHVLVRLLTSLNSCRNVLCTFTLSAFTILVLTPELCFEFRWNLVKVLRDPIV